MRTNAVWVNLQLIEVVHGRVVGCAELPVSRQTGDKPLLGV